MPSNKHPGYSGSRMPIDDPAAWMNPYPCQSCHQPFKTRHGLATHHCDPYGRNPKPAVIPRRKMTDDQVRSIREEAASGQYSQRKLAVKYGVSTTTIMRIVSRESYRNVSDESNT